MVMGGNANPRLLYLWEETGNLLCRRHGRTKGWASGVRKDSPPTEFDPQIGYVIVNLLTSTMVFQFLKYQFQNCLWMEEDNSLITYRRNPEGQRKIQKWLSGMGTLAYCYIRVDSLKNSWRTSSLVYSRVQLKRDGTRWRTRGEVKGKLANGVGSQYPSHYLWTWCIQHYYRWCAHLGC